MEYRTIEWDREKLYDQVWASPMRAVAKEHGLSDVGLAKVCKKLNIPTPGLGYWRRKECGFHVLRTPLPKAEHGLTAVSRVPVGSRPEPLRIPEDHMSPVRIPPPTERLHPLAKQTERAFANGSQDQFGRINCSDWHVPHFDLRVTRTGLTRAAGFTDSLVKLLEANNMRAALGNDSQDTKLRVHVDGEQIQISLREGVRGHKRPFTPAEKREWDRWHSNSNRDFTSEYDPTNRFVFEIKNYSDTQRTWADTKLKKIEESLQQIIQGIRAAAAYQKRARAEREVARRLEAEQQRRRYEEQARIETLKRDVAVWEEAQRIRAYLAAVRKTAEQRDGDLKAESPLGQFLAWAHRYADSLDPSGEQPGPKWKLT